MNDDWGYPYFRTPPFGDDGAFFGHFSFGMRDCDAELVIGRGVTTLLALWGAI